MCVTRNRRIDILTTSSNMGLFFLGAMRSSSRWSAAEPTAAGGHGRRIVIAPTLFGPALVRRGADTGRAVCIFFLFVGGSRAAPRGVWARFWRPRIVRHGRAFADRRRCCAERVTHCATLPGHYRIDYRPARGAHGKIQ